MCFERTVSHLDYETLEQSVVVPSEDEAPDELALRRGSSLRERSFAVFGTPSALSKARVIRGPRMTSHRPDDSHDSNLSPLPVQILRLTKLLVLLYLRGKGRLLFCRELRGKPNMRTVPATDPFRSE